MLLGMMASEPANAAAVRALLDRAALPCVCTYQGAGIIPRDKLELFGGRVGLFHNQPADDLLDGADVVIAVGYDPIEYDESLWNGGKQRPIVHIDVVPCELDIDYSPAVELVGDIAATLGALGEQLAPRPETIANPLLRHVREELESVRTRGMKQAGTPIHPLRIIAELQPFVVDDVTLWRDGAYNMVAFQQQMKYGRTTGVDFGRVDAVKFAEAFGATGFCVTKPDEIAPVLRKAMDTPGPVLIDTPVDYSHNLELAQQLHPDVLV